jgi:hypothetical protein
MELWNNEKNRITMEIFEKFLSVPIPLPQYSNIPLFPVIIGSPY